MELNRNFSLVTARGRGFLLEGSFSFSILPVYLVLDTSESMVEEDAFKAAFEFIPGVMREMNRSPVLSEISHIEVITFDQVAKVVFPLGSLDLLEKWYEEKKVHPIQPKGSWTLYSQAFDKLRERIELTAHQFPVRVSDHLQWQLFRPIVILVTDGFADGDTESSLENTYSRLTDPDFTYRPIIVCIGVGEATHETLRGFGAGRYGTQSYQYEIGNENLVWVASDGVTPGSALAQIIPRLVES